jgi:hypothetical protein
MAGSALPRLALTERAARVGDASENGNGRNLSMRSHALRRWRFRRELPHRFRRRKFKAQLPNGRMRDPGDSSLLLQAAMNFPP